MKDLNFCLFCGNTSGKLDSTGNCISCGAPYIQNYVEEKTVGKTLFPDFDKLLLNTNPNDSYIEKKKKDVKNYIIKERCKYIKETYDLIPDEIKKYIKKIESSPNLDHPECCEIEIEGIMNSVWYNCFRREFHCFLKDHHGWEELIINKDMIFIIDKICEKESYKEINN